MEDTKQCGVTGIKKIKLLVTIVDRGLGDEVAEALREDGVTFNLISPAYCAAGSQLMDYLGLTALERDLVFSVVSENIAFEMLNKVLYKFDLDEPSHGLAFTIPISGISGPLAFRYMVALQEQEDSGFPSNCDDPYDCVLTIVNRGFADQVVDGAKAAGAHGGTIFYARGTGIHEVEKFFSISIQPEKELVLNVVKHENVDRVMQAIAAAAGLGTEGRGLTFSLPIDDIVGIFCPCEDLKDE